METISGVPSYHASAAHSGSRWPRATRLAILPAGYGVDTVERLLPEFDTSVLLKVSRVDDLIDMLERRGCLRTAASSKRSARRRNVLCAIRRVSRVRR